MPRRGLLSVAAPRLFEAAFKICATPPIATGRDLAPRLGEPVKLSLQNSPGRFGWWRLVSPHPGPLPQGEGTPHPALRRGQALWIGESAADDSPSPRGRGLG